MKRKLLIFIGTVINLSLFAACSNPTKTNYVNELPPAMIEAEVTSISSESKLISVVVLETINHNFQHQEGDKIIIDAAEVIDDGSGGTVSENELENFMNSFDVGDIVEFTYVNEESDKKETYYLAILSALKKNRGIKR